jgi:NtrC-family two-component system response regulator AlgB
LPLPIQAKLLRVLQEKVYERVGDLETRKANVRVLAATNVDLESAVKTGRFREDLFYRLNVIEIVIPPLKERREDIVSLAEGLLVFFARQNHRRILGFSDEASEALKNYEWPGNVRELRNAIERAVLLCSDDKIGIHHFPLKLKPLERMPGAGDLVTMEELERTHIRRVLAASRSIEEACRTLGMDSVTLWRKRKKYGL